MVKDFDLKTIKKYFSLIVNGVRRSGKSRLVDFLISEIFDYEEHKFDTCYLISSTSKMQDDVFRFVPQENIIDELSDDKIRKIIDEREKIVESYKKNPHLFQYQPNALIIIDDMLSDSKGRSLWHNKQISKLFFMGRHIFCSLIVLSQYAKALSPLMRSNADLLIYFRDLRADNRKCVLDEYMCFCDDKEIKKKGEELMSSITSSRFVAMVVDRYKGQYSKSFDEYVFKIKGPEKYDNNKVKFQKLPKLFISITDDKEMDDKLIINNALKTKKMNEIEKPKKRILL